MIFTIITLAVLVPLASFAWGHARGVKLERSRGSDWASVMRANVSLRQDFDLAIDELDSMVRQHCSVGDGVSRVDSGIISTNADAIHFLAKHGRCRIVGEPHGRWVEAEMIEWDFPCDLDADGRNA